MYHLFQRTKGSAAMSASTHTDGIQCHECHQRPATKLHNGDGYCQECFDELFVTCSCCGKIVAQEDSSYQDDEHWCSKCFSDNFSRCAHCEEYVSNDAEWTEVAGGEQVCEYCCEEHYTYCERCDTYHHNEDVVDGFCLTCRDETKECPRCKDRHDIEDRCKCNPTYVTKLVEFAKK